MKNLLPVFLVAICALFAVSQAFAETPGPRILPVGELPNDSRLGALATLNDYHPLRPSESAEQWKVRSGEIRRRILVGSGLWPMPEKTALNTVIHSRKDMGDYTVENVFFESLQKNLQTIWKTAGKPTSLRIHNSDSSTLEAVISELLK
jgi:hypothetical protein